MVTGESCTRLFCHSTHAQAVEVVAVRMTRRRKGCITCKVDHEASVAPRGIAAFD